MYKHKVPVQQPAELSTQVVVRMSCARLHTILQSTVQTVGLGPTCHLYSVRVRHNTVCNPLSPICSGYCVLASLRLWSLLWSARSTPYSLVHSSHLDFNKHTPYSVQSTEEYSIYMYSTRLFVNHLSVFCPSPHLTPYRISADPLMVSCLSRKVKTALQTSVQDFCSDLFLRQTAERAGTFSLKIRNNNKE